jgi:hypothetical protein
MAGRSAPAAGTMTPCGCWSTDQLPGVRRDDEPARYAPVVHRRSTTVRSHTAIVVLVALVTIVAATVLPVTPGGASSRARATPGAIVSATPIPDPPAGSSGWRIVYRTTTADGAPATSSGTVYAPTAPASKGSRPVVAWAHPTLGFGADCTPSQAADPAAGIPGLASMLAQGWVVTSSDYTGLGTPGVLPYLIGEGEARNVIDSVRAARALRDTGAGTTFAVWGHSQGGHASLFTADVVRKYAPTLRLIGVAAAAPAAELESLVALQWQQVVAWVIGSEVITLWPKFYPDLDIAAIATPVARENAARVGAICITSDVTTLLLAAGPVLLQPFFSTDPTQVPRWRARLIENIPRPARGVPVYVAQGLQDTVVLPATTAQLEANWCARKARITVDWYPDADHFDIPDVAATSAVDWLADRFDRRAAGRSCATPPPVTPATNPPRPAGT